MDLRLATAEDVADVARLLHDFNTEFDEPTPGVTALTEYSRRLLVDGEMPAVVLQERLARIVQANNQEATAPLRIITPAFAHGSPLDCEPTRATIEPSPVNPCEAKLN